MSHAAIWPGMIFSHVPPIESQCNILGVSTKVSWDKSFLFVINENALRHNMSLKQMEKVKSNNFEAAIQKIFKGEVSNFFNFPPKSVIII